MSWAKAEILRIRSTKDSAEIIPEELQADIDGNTQTVPLQPAGEVFKRSMIVLVTLTVFVRILYRRYAPVGMACKR